MTLAADSAAAAHYRLTVAYDGRGFFGWQRLKDKATVQGTLEAAVQQAFGERVSVQAAGRTDRGAHAEGQSVGLALAEAVHTDDLVGRLNAALPDSVRVLEATTTDAAAHVRNDAIAKDYEYRISSDPALEGRVWLSDRPLDLAAMQAAVGALVGTHDFASFATRPRFAQKSTVCTISHASVAREGGVVFLRFRGDRFLMHMVRNMVRAIVKVGEGRHGPERIGAILKARDRKASPGSAPASGLYLMKVYYPELSEGPTHDLP